MKLLYLFPFFLEISSPVDSVNLVDPNILYGLQWTPVDSVCCPTMPHYYLAESPLESTGVHMEYGGTVKTSIC